MPGWHKKTVELQKAGKLQVVGVIQEQHPERCRLFNQWKELEWPVLVDSLNLHGVPAIPYAMLVDEAGVIVSARANDAQLEAFLAAPPARGGKESRLDLRDVAALRKAASSGSMDGLRSLGDALFLWGGTDGTTEAITTYRQVVEKTPKDARAWFRLGVAHRRRYDGDDSRPGDFVHASNAWSRALELNAGQYIWRRRIQQYGPTLDKPYNFYRWVAEARTDLEGKDVTPVSLRVPLTMSEKAEPGRGRTVVTSRVSSSPDPEGKIPLDKGGLVTIEAVAVPARAAPGSTIRIHVVLELDAGRKAHWDPDAGPATLWMNPPAPWNAGGARSADDSAFDSAARRRIEFELTVPETAQPGEDVQLEGLVVYPVCEDANGQCLFLRQTVTVAVGIAKPRARRRSGRRGR